MELLQGHRKPVFFYNQHETRTSEGSAQEHYKLEQFQTFLMSLGKGNLPVNDDGNINLPEELVASGFQVEENMQDAAIEYVYGDINGQVDDIIIKNEQYLTKDSSFDDNFRFFLFEKCRANDTASRAAGCTTTAQ